MLTNKRRTLGFFINKTDHYYQDVVSDAVSRFAAALDYDLFIFNTVGYRGSSNEYDEQEKAMFRFVPIEELDGILVSLDTYQMNDFRPVLISTLKERAKCPVVCVRDRTEAMDRTYTDEREAIRPIIRHIIYDHKCTDVRFMAGYAGHPDGDIRLSCYLEEMKKAGLEVNDRSIFVGDMWKKKAPEAYEFFFENGEKPQAIICANDYMAVSLCAEAIRHGCKVPEDVIISGFDNIDESRNSIPTITTVEQDYVGMAREAVTLIDRRIHEREAGLPPEAPQSVAVPVKLLKRESCGCASPTIEHYRNIGRVAAGEITKQSNRQVSLTYFSINVYGCDTYADMSDAIFRKLGDIATYSDFYLCLFGNKRKKDDSLGGEPTDNEKAVTEYADNMTDEACVISSISEGKELGLFGKRFSRRLILPPEAEKDEPQTYNIMLLHQNDQCFGYTAIRFPEHKVPNQFYQEWNVIIANELRHIHQKQVLERLYRDRHMSSVTDALTGLYNRRGFEERLSEIWQESCESHMTVTFAGIDLDSLKQINDNYGHEEGDSAIILVGKALRLASTPDGICMRFGGDEFAVFLPDCDEDGAKAYSARVGEVMQRLNEQSKKAYTVSSSIGLYTVTLKSGDTVMECLRQSDTSMYIVKRDRKLRRRASDRINEQ
ncbi:MAG: GGDEF domain-containing protein [Eubacteriales bacterium]|nr:GGDEF domain-containing protein [Eubacteriales bacterium]MDD3881285.1 GGDEF domain-containing protein [Eubacteriales bacterium]MDD4512203.1 GGDEF domain-containing protein [Eubacteriales bacterium]